MPPPRLVATDLDGTLLRHGGVVSARTVGALRLAAAAGAEVVAVTSRPPWLVERVVAAAGLAGLLRVAVCSNGALVYDLERRTVLTRRALPAATAQAVAAALRSVAPEMGFALEMGDRVVYEPGFGLWLEEEGTLEPVASVERLWLTEAPIAKMLAWCPAVDADTLMAAAERLAGGLARYTHSGGPGLLEVSAAGVAKETALAAWCAERGVAAAEVVAFGDMPNDLGVLRWAGAGYAMANAHPSVLAGVRLRTTSNQEDGVAAVLERLYDAPVPAARPDGPEPEPAVPPG